jgi:hypothetical protein
VYTKRERCDGVMLRLLRNWRQIVKDLGSFGLVIVFVICIACFLYGAVASVPFGVYCSRQLVLLRAESCDV